MALDANVTIDFTENVLCSTVNTTSITSDSPGWTFSTCSGSQAVFTTSGQANSTTYNVNVTTAVTDLASNPLSAAYPFSYETLAGGGPDSLSVTNTALASSAVEGNTDVQMQRLQVDCTAGGGDDGVCEITGITVDDLGAVTGTEIDNLNIYIDTDTSFLRNRAECGRCNLYRRFKSDRSHLNCPWFDGRSLPEPQNISGSLMTWPSGSAPATVQTSVTAVAVNTGSGDTGATGTWNSNNFAITAAGGPDSLSVINTAVASFATEGNTDVQMQRLQA